MDYPVIIDGKRVGVLHTRKNGLMTEFECALDIPEKLIRLWLIGDGAYCLGVMEPRGGRMYLRRSLSRRELERLPRSISHVSDRQETGAVYEAPKTVSREGERVWQEDKEGVLTCNTGNGIAVAIPAELKKGSPGYDRLVTINGKTYLLFL